MAEKKNNLNALLARLKNKEKPKPKSESPSLLSQAEQSAFGDQNNISNLLQENYHKMDDSSFAHNNNEATPNYRQDKYDISNKQSIVDQSNLRKQMNSEPIINNSLAMGNDNNSLAFENNNLKNEFENMKASIDMVNFDLKKSNNNVPVNSNNNFKTNDYTNYTKPQKNNISDIKDSFEIEEIEDIPVLNNQNSSNNVQANNANKNNNFFNNNYNKPSNKGNNVIGGNPFNKINKIESNSILKELSDLENISKAKIDPEQNKSKLGNDYDNKSIPSHIDMFNNLKNMQRLSQRENFETVQREIEKKNSLNNKSIQNEILEKKQKIANEYQSKLSNSKFGDDTSSNRNNFFSKEKYGTNQDKEKAAALQKELEYAEKQKQEYLELVKQEEQRNREEKIRQEREDEEREFKKKLQREREAQEEELKKERERVKKMQEEEEQMRQERMRKIKEEHERELEKERERIKKLKEEEEVKLEQERLKYQEEMRKIKEETMKLQKEKEKYEEERQRELENYRKELEKQKLKEIEDNKRMEEELLKQRQKELENMKKQKEEMINKYSKVDKNGKPIGNASLDYNPNGNSEIEIEEIDDKAHLKKQTNKITAKNNYATDKGLLETDEDREDDEENYNKQVVQMSNIDLKEEENSDFELNDSLMKGDFSDAKEFQKKLAAKGEKIESNKKIKELQEPDLMSALEKKNKEKELQEKRDREAKLAKEKEDQEREKNKVVEVSEDKEVENKDDDEYDESKIVVKPVNNKEEDYYHAKFEDFNKSFPDKTYTYISRRQALFSNQYFNGHIMSEINLIDVVKQINLIYSDNLESQYAEHEDKFYEIFSKEMIDTSDEYMQSIINTNPDINPYLGNISNLQSLDTLFTKSYNYKEPVSELKGMKYFRASNSDGDSFYRLVMLSLIEDYILDNDRREIEKLVLDIHFRIANDDKDLDKNTVNALIRFYQIIYLCLNSMKENDIFKAHAILLLGFNSPDKSLDFILVHYLRKLVYLVMINIESNYSNRPKRKTIKRMNNEEHDDINPNLIFHKQHEACKFSLQLVPTIFNINLNIISVDGCVDNKEPKFQIKYNKFYPLTPKIEGKEPTTRTINLLYNINKYDLLYSEEKKSKMDIDNKEIYNSEFKLTEKQKCHKCEQMEEFVAIPFYGISFCYGCALAYIKILAFQRISIMNRENFINREFYSRPFEIVSGVFIGDELYTSIFKENIIQTVIKNLKYLCFTCSQQKEEKDIKIIKECKCNYCKECLNAIVNKSTFGFKVTNKFEKSKVTTRCTCYDLFNIDSALELMELDLVKLKAEALERQNEYAQSLCISCQTKVRENLDSVDEDIFKTLSILNELKNPEDKEVSFVTHTICLKCIEVLITADEENPNAHLDKTANKEIFCEICKVTHLIDHNVWKKIVKKPCECIII